LLTEALLNPELARTLMQASKGNVPFFAKRLQNSLRTILIAPSAQGQSQRR